MSGFNWGLTPSGKEPEKPEDAAETAPESAAEPASVDDDPFAIFRTPVEPPAAATPPPVTSPPVTPPPAAPPRVEPDLPPTEAMPTSQEPYRPAPAAPVEPPAEPFVFPSSFGQQQPADPAPQQPFQPAPPPFRPPSQYPTHPPVSQYPPTDAAAAPPATGPATSATPTGTGRTAGIDDIFGESAFVHYEDAPLLAQLPLRRDAAAPREPREPLGRNQRMLIGVAAGLVAVIVLVLVFVIGTNLPGLIPSAAAKPTASAPAPQVTKTEAAPTTGALAPGVHAWNTLNGGECIEPFDTAWAAEFTVVDCATGHSAQLVATGTFTDASFPTAEKLATEAKAACVSSKVIDYAAAGAYDDLELSTSYATSQAEWDSGFTSYYCFVSRPDRKIDGSVAKG